MSNIYDNLISKLFGNMGDRLTDTFSMDWKVRDVGFVGKLDGRLTELEAEVKRLNVIIEDLKRGVI